MDTAVLQETRNLLNSLNEENSELKAHAEHLTQQWRQAVNELDLERQRFAQLEHDSKQINTNLIKQLKALQSDGKSAQSTQDMLERRAHSMELQLERLADEKASAEDRVAALERNLQEAIAREERERREKLDARAETDRISAELQRTLNAEREQTVASERSLATRCDELALELQRQQDLVSSLRKQQEVQKRESERAIEKLRAQLEAANEDAARTRHAEAECTYAHEEVHAVAESYYESLSDLQARCRATEIESAEVGNSLNKITDKFRNLALAASAQRKNSEALINFYSANYIEVKQLLEATVAENFEIRNSAEERVAAAASEIERQARDAAIRQEKAHQDQLSATIASLESRQRERDALAKENERLKDALRESHETEKQLRVFSEQLYADVVGAQKVASEAAEKERSAKAELTTLEHRVAEQVRRDVVAAFEQERSKLVSEFNRAKRDYELEITELRSKLEENAMTLKSALNKIAPSSNARNRSISSSKYSSDNNNNNHQHHQYFTQNQYANQNPRDYTDNEVNDEEGENDGYQSNNNQQQQQQQQQQRSRMMMPSSSTNSSNIVSPETPVSVKKQQQPQQVQGKNARSASATLDRDRYSVEPSLQQHQEDQNYINNNNNNINRSSSAPILLQQQQQMMKRNQPSFQDDGDVDYSVAHDHDDSSSASPSPHQHRFIINQKSQNNNNHQHQQQIVTSSHSPLRNVAALPLPVQQKNNKGFLWETNSRNKTMMIQNSNYKNADDDEGDQDQEQNSTSSPSQLRWPPSSSMTRNAATLRQKTYR